MIDILRSTMAFAAKFDPGIPQELRALPPRMVVRRRKAGTTPIGNMVILFLLFGGGGFAMLVGIPSASRSCWLFLPR